MRDFFKNFYNGQGPKIPGRKPIDMNKSFFEPEQPGTRELSKSGTGFVDPVAILDYHMKKAQRKKDKDRGLER